MKIMMTIIMKNTKVSQDLLGQINNFKPLLHKTAEYEFHGNCHYSRVIAFTISFNQIFKHREADRGFEYTS